MPMVAWRAGVLSRLQGVVVNRLDLRVSPQEGNAGKLEVKLPLKTVFDASGKVANPEMLSNMVAAAGSESTLTWQVVGNFENTEQMAGFIAALARVTGHAEAVTGEPQEVRLIVVPGAATKPNIGLQVQQVGEDAGGTVEGVQDKGTARE